MPQVNFSIAVILRIASIGGGQVGGGGVGGGEPKGRVMQTFRLAQLTG